MRRRRLRQDFYIVALSIAVALGIIYFGAVEVLFEYTKGSILLVFFAGALFTSVVTTAPAIAVLGELSLHMHPVLVALVGAAGGVCGDFLLFFFVRDRLGEDISYLLKRTGTPRFFKIFHRKSFRWVASFVGALVIASPLPDELGLALLGFNKMSTGRFILISFSLNALGIFLIGMAARSIAL